MKQPLRLPAELAAIVDVATAEEVHLGKSRSRVFQLAGGYFLKTTESLYAANELEQERKMLGWLAFQGIPAPRPLLLTQEAGTTFFLMTRIPGRSLLEEGLEASECLRQGASFLARLHKVEGCRVQRTLHSTRKLARDNWEKGLIDVSDFDADHRGIEPERLLTELDEDLEQDLVFTHGDYCLANILAEGGRLSGVVDLGRAGVADRYQDIAIFLRSYRAKFGHPDEQAFLAAYGLIGRLDRRKLDFYRKLDEFF